MEYSKVLQSTILSQSNNDVLGNCDAYQRKIVSQ